MRDIREIQIGTGSNRIGQAGNRQARRIEQAFAGSWQEGIARVVQTGICNHAARINRKHQRVGVAVTRRQHRAAGQAGIAQAVVASVKGTRAVVGNRYTQDTQVAVEAGNIVQAVDATRVTLVGHHDFKANRVGPIQQVRDADNRLGVRDVLQVQVFTDRDCGRRAGFDQRRRVEQAFARSGSYRITRIVEAGISDNGGRIHGVHQGVHIRGARGNQGVGREDRIRAAVITTIEVGRTAYHDPEDRKVAVEARNVIQVVGARFRTRIGHGDFVRDVEGAIQVVQGSDQRFCMEHVRQVQISTSGCDVG